MQTLKNLETSDYRRATAVKRGGGARHDPYPEEGVADDSHEAAAHTDALESLRAVIDRLGAEHPAAHAVLERKLAGASWADIGAEVARTADAAKALWEFARAWLRRELEQLGD